MANTTETTVGIGTRWKDGNVSFRVIRKILEKEDTWEVGYCVPSGGFGKSIPKNLEMTTGEIIRAIGEYSSSVAMHTMHTIGTRIGSSRRTTSTKMLIQAIKKIRGQVQGQNGTGDANGQQFA